MTQAMRMLLAEGLISRDALERALTLKAAHGGTASFHLVEAGAIGADELALFMARRFPLPRWPRQRLGLVPPPALAAIPPALARALRVVPVARSEGALTVAVVDPTERHALDEAARAAGMTVMPVLVSEADMSFALERHYGLEAPPIRPSDEIPLPLTRRVTRKMAVVAEEAAEVAVTPGGDSIAAAVDAIPLVRRTASAAPPSAPAAPAPEAARPAIDSWHSDPAPAPPLLRRQPADAEAGGAEDGPARVRSEGEIVAAIDQAPDRDAVIALALGYLRRFAARAAFFTVKRAEIRGFDIVDEESHRDAARSLWFPLSAQSTLRKVAEERQVHVGPLGGGAADAVLAAALGGRPERVIVVPVAIKGRTVGLLMADGFAEAPPRARLERLSGAVAEAFTRLIAVVREA
jgi:hypothetical protein